MQSKFIVSAAVSSEENPLLLSFGLNYLLVHPLIFIYNNIVTTIICFLYATLYNSSEDIHRVCKLCDSAISIGVKPLTCKVL